MIATGHSPACQGSPHICICHQTRRDAAFTERNQSFDVTAFYDIDGARRATLQEGPATPYVAKTFREEPQPRPDTLFDDAEDCAALFKEPGTLVPEEREIIATRIHSDFGHQAPKEVRPAARSTPVLIVVLVGLCLILGPALLAHTLGWF